MDSRSHSAHTHGYLAGLGTPAIAPGVGESCFIQEVRLPVVQNSFGPVFTTGPGSAQVPSFMKFWALLPQVSLTMLDVMQVPCSQGHPLATDKIGANDVLFLLLFY